MNPQWDKNCKTAPAPNEVPTLRPGEWGDACDRTKYPLDPPNNKDLDPIELMKSARPAIVRIDLKRELSMWQKIMGDRDVIEGGTGFAVGEIDGECLIVTNEHVANPEDSKVHSVRLEDGTTSDKINVRVLSAENDLAILGVRLPAGTKCKPLKIDPAPIDYREKLAVFGHPKGSNQLFYSPSKLGVIKETTPALLSKAENYDIEAGEDRNRKIYIIDAHVKPGNSGSPLLNKDGDVRAVLFKGSHQRGAFTPSADLQKLIDRAKAKSKAKAG